MSKQILKIATLDAETDPFEFNRIPEPFIWGFYDGDTYEKFEGDNCTNDLVEFLSQLEGKYCIYAHNGGKFDFFFLLEHIAEDIKIINGRISQMRLKYNKQIKFRDSMNIFPMPLSAYAKDDIDYDKMQPENRHKHMPEIKRYLYKDCIYLYQIVSAFNDQYGNKLTIAGTAFNELKKAGYIIPKSFQSYDDMLRPFYYGGRVQCFKTGAYYGDYIYADIKSAYPYAMLSDHPQKTDYTNTKILPKYAGGWFAEISAISNGCLPVRGDDNLLSFPIDDVPRIYRATGWEIIAGIETNTLKILDVHIVYEFLDCENFSDYILPLYKARLEAKANKDKIADLFNKLLMNSAYGKYGQDGSNFEDFKITDFGVIPEGDEWTTYSDLETGQRVHFKPAPSESFYNVATAASITGYVRAFLWRHICGADTPIYCDTDSIICKSFNGEIGIDLGQWEIEAELTELYIAQKKMYAVKTKTGEWKSASKGVKLEPEQIKEGVLSKVDLIIERPAPAFSLRAYKSSLKYGGRFFERTVNFSKI